MNFDIHLLTNLEKYHYAAICNETGHIIYFGDDYMQLLPPGSIRFPKEYHLPTTRSFKLDCKLIDALVGDHQGRYSFSMLIRLDNSRHITVKYYNERGETKRTIEIKPGLSNELDTLLNTIYPIMEEIDEKVFDADEDEETQP